MAERALYVFAAGGLPQGVTMEKKQTKQKNCQSKKSAGNSAKSQKDCKSCK